MTMHILKEFMLYKWASDGITHKQIKQFIKSGGTKTALQGLQKKAAAGYGSTAIELLTETLPIWSIVGPTIAGGILYAATHPDAIRERDRKKRIETLDRAIAKVREEGKKKRKKEIRLGGRFDII